MSVTNNGILPATARISMDPHSCFQLAPGPLLITLASKQSHRIAADFTATVVKQHAHEVSHMTPLLLHPPIQGHATASICHQDCTDAVT